MNEWKAGMGTIGFLAVIVGGIGLMSGDLQGSKDIGSVCI